MISMTYLSRRLDALPHGEKDDEPRKEQTDEHPPVDPTDIPNRRSWIERFSVPKVLRFWRICALHYFRSVGVLWTRGPRQLRLQQKNDIFSRQNLMELLRKISLFFAGNTSL
jgi:hypothetical protein